MAWDCVWYLCLTVGMLGLWHFLSKIMGEGLKAFLTETSRNITSFYCIHWVFVICVTNVILYIVNGTQIFPIPYVMLIALGIDIATWIIAHYWNIWKKIVFWRLLTLIRRQALRNCFKGSRRTSTFS